jgi:phosphatidylserine decarboxylase
MRIGLTKYGLPQVVVFPAVILAAMIIYLVMGIMFLSVWVFIATELILSILLVFVTAFFRDPFRASPQDDNILLSPADGRITDIEEIQNEYTGGPALRIGIFLSIFDAHINRAPCEVKVAKIEYKKGKFKDARNPSAGKVNESNDLKLVRIKEPADKLIVRQISGAVARRIVCKAGAGDVLSGGEKFGMIKFGSRTELYVPLSSDIECAVRVGEKVKAGLTILARYKKCRN